MAQFVKKFLLWAHISNKISPAADISGGFYGDDNLQHQQQWHGTHQTDGNVSGVVNDRLLLENLKLTDPDSLSLESIRSLSSSISATHSNTAAAASPHHPDNSSVWVRSLNNVKEFRERYLKSFVSSSYFRIAFMIVIYINCIIIGIRTEKALDEKYGALFVTFHYLFIVLYLMEVLLKWSCDFLGFWKVSWNVFDFIILLTAIFGPSFSFIQGSQYLLRLLRMVLATKSIKSITTLKGLKVVVKSIIHSIPSMLNILLLLLLIMFIFAVIGVSIFGTKCPVYFGSLGTAMLALFICFTQDGWTSIRLDLQACHNDIIGPLYLAVFVIIGAFVLGNLVVAIIVTNLEWALIEKESQSEEKNVVQTETSLRNNVIQTTDPSSLLPLIANRQRPVEIPVINPTLKQLEKYYLILSVIEGNLEEFKTIKKQLIDIFEQIKLLTQLDDASSTVDSRSIGLGSSIKRVWSSVSRNDISPHSFEQHQGDTVSRLITLTRHHSISLSNVSSIASLITQLRSPSPAAPRSSAY